ncbi:four helix bundle protein [Polaribacter sp. MSW5]|uniref:Four helix bundle protein n=1 Tax=Polaribacter ponticola TaxID=2978475 RepID=A0ABT5SBV3_9FLAO|nr:four helix bundle protein [Polaribacter sp. MSW5]MDD7915558.1 four helix bundle protein [Polaribacter sp. MSW5]
MHRYNDLRFWQLSRVFCRDIYQITNSFSYSEKFGLVSLLRRASVSIPSNMAKSASKNQIKTLQGF